MGYTPPQPGKLKALTDAAQAFTYDSRSSGFRNALNALVFPVLTATSKPGVVEWEVDDYHSGSCPLFLLSDTTYQILRDGTLSTDGLTVDYRGQSYFARAVRHGDGSQWVELVTA